MRYVRAFFTALKRTLAGDIPRPSPLAGWMAEALRQLDALEKLAAQQNLDPRQVQVAVDRRPMPMATMLAIARFHLTDEYPIMLRHQTHDSLNYIYATNLDDHFRLMRLEAIVEHPPLRDAIIRLCQHLEAIPQVENK
jgi:hypothetical protein